MSLGAQDRRADSAGFDMESRVEDGRLARVLNALCLANEPKSEQRRQRPLPSRDAVQGIVEGLKAVLYPVHFGSSDAPGRSLRYRIGVRLDKAQAALREQLERGFELACEHVVRDVDRADSSNCRRCAVRANEVTDEVIARLPEIRALLDADVEAAFQGDPAAQSIDETLFCYPGVAAILQHRIAHELHRFSVPLIPRIISELAHAGTVIDIHPGAEIGPSFFIDHGTGVVIGETALIGERVRLYQGVTLGARSSASDDQGHLIKGLLRHPDPGQEVLTRQYLAAPGASQGR